MPVFAGITTENDCLLFSLSWRKLLQQKHHCYQAGDYMADARMNLANAIKTLSGPQSLPEIFYPFHQIDPILHYQHPIRQ
jgi:hypothetical protein